MATLPSKDERMKRLEERINNRLVSIVEVVKDLLAIDDETYLRDALNELQECNDSLWLISDSWRHER